MSAQTARIAIIDDEPEILEILSFYLSENFDCEIETFTDPVVALARLKETRFDVVSLDFRMPKMTGLDLLKALRGGSGPNHDVRVLLVTGFADDAKAHDVSLDLLTDVLVIEKPVKEASYVRNVRIMLHKKGSSARVAG